MKTKLIIAALACLALGACNQESGSKEEKKAVEQSQETGTPSAPSSTDSSTPGHSSIDATNQFAAADDQNNTTSPSMDHSTGTTDANGMKQGAGQSGYSTDSTTSGSTDSTTSSSGTTSPNTSTGGR